MNILRIANALKEIEDELPDGSHQVRFDVWGGAVDESFIRGTRPGLVYMGTKLIHAALQEGKGAPESRLPIAGAFMLC